MNEGESGISELGFQLAIKQTTTVRQTSEVIVKYWTILCTPAMTKVSVKKYEVPCRLYWCLVIIIHKGQELKLESWSRHLILCNTLD